MNIYNHLSLASGLIPSCTQHRIRPRLDPHRTPHLASRADGLNHILPSTTRHYYSFHATTMCCAPLLCTT